MKKVSQGAFQGDCLVFRVPKVPDGMKEANQSGPLVVAHSETGHNHQISERLGVRMFEDPGNPLRAFLVLETVEYADLEHMRSFDTHETLRLLGPGNGSVWEVRRQREHTPEGWRRAQD